MILLTHERQTMVILHGVLMAVAWVLVLPIGMMAARHRWVFNDRKVRARRTSPDCKHVEGEEQAGYDRS